MWACQCSISNGKHTKNCPKEFNKKAMSCVNGFPQYQHRDNGRTVRVRNVDVDDCWVVPYNPWLSKKYAVHINVEACTVCQ